MIIYNLGISGTGNNQRWGVNLGSGAGTLGDNAKSGGGFIALVAGTKTNDITFLKVVAARNDQNSGTVMNVNNGSGVLNLLAINAQPSDKGIGIINILTLDANKLVLGNKSPVSSFLADQILSMYFPGIRVGRRKAQVFVGVGLFREAVF